MTEKKEKGLNIYQKIFKVMESVDFIQKDNKMVAGQYKAVLHDAVVAKLRPAIIENRMVLIPSVTSSSQDGNRTEVTINVKVVNVDDPNDFIMVEGVGQGIDTQDKGVGKAISYAFKYVLLKLFFLETGDDPERDNVNFKPSETGDEKKSLKTNPVKTEGESKVTPEEIDDTMEKGQGDAFETSTTPLDVFLDLMATCKTPEDLKGFWTKAENVKFRAGLTEPELAKVVTKKDALKKAFAKKAKETKE